MATILIVDDNEGMRDFLRTALERAGHNVIEAANGFGALELLHQSPNVVVTDIIMPDMEGI
jgi:CheY-like chemotaxis protein